LYHAAGWDASKENAASYRLASGSYESKRDHFKYVF
jgi:hypothetical protein